jgi:hypothetical protein
VATGGSASPLTLTSSPGNNFNYSASFASQAAMDAAFPLGIPYTFQISGGTLGTESASLNTPGAALNSAIPFLAGSSYSQLQGLNAALSDTVGINGFSPVAGTTESFAFFTITRQSDNAVVFQQGFLSPGTTSIFVAANTLAASTAYKIDLDYSSRITTANAGFGTASSPHRLRTADRDRLHHGERSPRTVQPRPRPDGSRQSLRCLGLPTATVEAVGLKCEPARVRN